MPETYPIPAHAASFWVAGDDLWIAFPGQGPEGKGHSVRLPASAAGLATAVSIMKERAAAESLRLGNRGTPTQYEIEAGKAWGKVSKRMREEHAAEIEARAADIAAGRAALAAAKAKAAAELEELGL